jgi:3-isopropylmalate/(R)-2-methylmalate dehydratase small subunit
MTPFITLVGRGVALRRNNVDTDQIIPAEFCKRLTKAGYADALFAQWRKEPDFVLCRAASAGAPILIGAENFGTGSSREHAVWALRDWGFRAVFASSFGDIFQRNALKNGLLAIKLDETELAWLCSRVEADPALEIKIDLEQQSIAAAGRAISFKIDSRARWLLLNGYDEISVTLRHAPEIDSYEQVRAEWMPTLRPHNLSSEIDKRALS